MTAYRQAKLFFLTEPLPGVYVINIDDGKKFTRFQINKRQLGNAVVDGAMLTLRTYCDPVAIEATETGKQWTGTPLVSHCVPAKTEEADEREYRR